MIEIISALLILGSTLLAPHWKTALAEETPIPLTALGEPYSTSTASRLVRFYADKWDVSYEKLWATVSCENPELDPMLQSRYIDSKGLREESYGLAQWNLHSHPEITLQEAQDPDISLDRMAEAFSKGEMRQWTCYRMLFSDRSG